MENTSKIPNSENNNNTIQKPTKQKWERDYSHNWNILKETNILSMMEHLTLNSTEDFNENKILIQEIKKENKINYNFNFLRNLIIIIDLSEYTNKVDFKPNRFEFIFQKLEKFIVEFFNYNLSSSIVIIGTRNYCSEFISPFSQDSEFILNNIHQKKKIFTPSGYFSITNSLNLSFEIFQSNKEMNNDILIILSSPITLDKDNIFNLLGSYNKKVQINIISLETPFELLNLITKETNGDLIYPKNEKEIEEFLIKMIFKKINNIDFKISIANCLNNDGCYCPIHKKLHNLIYSCSACNDFSCKLPFYCKRCEFLNVSKAIIYQLKQTKNNNISFENNCKPYKLYKYYFEYKDNGNYINFANEYSKIISKRHKKKFIKSTLIGNENNFNYESSCLSYKIRLLNIYLRFINKNIFNNFQKNLIVNTEKNINHEKMIIEYNNNNINKEDNNNNSILDSLIKETKSFLLEENLKCSGCEKNIDVNKEEDLKFIIVYSKCLDYFCEDCYKYLLDNNMGCISCESN